MSICFASKLDKLTSWNAGIPYERAASYASEGLKNSPVSIRSLNTILQLSRNTGQYKMIISRLLMNETSLDR